MAARGFTTILMAVPAWNRPTRSPTEAEWSSVIFTPLDCPQTGIQVARMLDTMRRNSGRITEPVLKFFESGWQSKPRIAINKSMRKGREGFTAVPESVSLSLTAFKVKRHLSLQDDPFRTVNRLTRKLIRCRLSNRFS